MKSTNKSIVPLSLACAGLGLLSFGLPAQGGPSTTPVAQQASVPQGNRWFDDIDVPMPAFTLQQSGVGPVSQDPKALLDQQQGVDAPLLDARFQSVVHTGWNTPDPAIATGPEHVVVATNGRIQLRRKDGSYVTQFSPTSLFQPLGNTSGMDLFDPQAMFDQREDRYLIAYNSRNSSGSLRNIHYLAVSKTDDPTKGWWLYSTNLKAVGNRAGSYVAYRPRLGVNAKSIFISSVMFDPNNGTFAYTKLRFLQNKAQLLNGSASPKYWDRTNLRLHGTLTKAIYVVPAKHRSDHVNGYPAVFAATASGSGNRIYLWKATKTDDQVGGPVLTSTSVLVNSYKAAGHAPQKGSSVKIRSQGTRLGNVVYSGSRLRTIHAKEHNYGNGPVSALAYYELNLSSWLANGFTPTVKQQLTFGASSLFYFNPSLAWNGSGDMAVVFNASGSSMYPSVRYTGQRKYDAANKFQTSAALQTGVAPYTLGTKNGLCNFSLSTDADSNDAGRMSFVGAYVRSTNSWSTYVGSVFPEDLVVPAHTAGKFGSAYSRTLFANPQQRYQLIDVSQAGLGSRQITGVGYRLENRNFGILHQQGRKFSAKVFMTETERNKYSSIFLSNRDKAKIQVFDGVISLPTVTQNITSLQSFQTGAVNFSQPWLYSGSSNYAMTTEYELSNGTLNNGQSFINEKYYLDAGPQTVSRVGPYQVHGGNCYDSNMAEAGQAVPGVEVYAAEVNTTRSGQIVASMSGTSAKNALTFYAFGLLPFAQPVDIGACNKLYFDPIGILPLVADGNGKRTIQLGKIAYNPAYVGARLYTQLGWGDTQTGALVLGKAGSRPVVTAPSSPELWAVYASNLATGIGSYPTYSPTANPARAYRQ